MKDIVSDGRVCDRAHDPSAEHRVYIRPGDEKREIYRLITFENFPKEVCVNECSLAHAGFLYTGYKDRVCCFCCGIRVENWTVEDDVTLPKWHKTDCKMMLNQECGNIPLDCTTSNRTSRPTRSNHNFQNRTFVLAHIPLSSHGQLIKSLDLCKEEDRKKTFANWPQPSSIDPGELARNGFFYLGNLDRVQCFSCGIVFRGWKIGDVANAEHKRHSPNCRMVTGTDSRNIPLRANQPLTAAYPPTDLQEFDSAVLSEEGSLYELFPCLNPINPHMKSEDARRKTFDSRWPQNKVKATPRQISEAGFYFLGERDRTKCWYCNGGLQNWEPDDDPWFEHAKWFPKCEFVLQHKGPDFVHKVVSQHPKLRRPYLTNGYNGPLLASLGLGGHQSFPPSVIDPNADLKEQVRVAMELPIVKKAVEMGYIPKYIKKIIKMKLERDHEMYPNLSDLVDGLMSDSSDEDHEHPLNRLPPAHETANALRLAEDRARNSEQKARRMEDRAQSSENEAEEMRRELQELDIEKRCKICLDAGADVVFTPCGHLCSCENCAAALRNCPICRCKIAQKIRTYHS